jgi:hypothetical protein
MPDLHERFRTLDYLPQPDLWDEIEARAIAAPTRTVSRATPVKADARVTATPTWSASRSTPILIVVGLLLVALAAAILTSGGWPQPVPAETPSQAPLVSPPASLASNVAPQGTWVATGGMVHRRTEGHSVTLLGDGRVLVAGGGGSGTGDAWQAAELYDPATGTWRATGDMLEGRQNHTATLLADGKVLVTGGVSGSAIEKVLRSAEIFDPGTGAWTSTANLRGPRQGHIATLLPDARVLIVGDRDRTAEIFDPVTGTWSTTTEMPEPRDVSTATLLLDGRVLYVGWAGPSSSGSGVTSAQLYDPATASWTPTGSMVQRRSGHTATLLQDGRVLVAGRGAALPRPGAEVYDPQTNSWTQVGDMVEPRAWFAAGLLPDGRVLVTGSGDGGYGGSPTAEIFDPATGTWALAPNMLSEHGYHEGVTLDDGRFLVVGGFPRGEPSAETYDVGSLR